MIATSSWQYYHYRGSLSSIGLYTSQCLRAIEHDDMKPILVKSAPLDLTHFQGEVFLSSKWRRSIEQWTRDATSGSKISRKVGMS